MSKDVQLKTIEVTLSPETFNRLQKSAQSLELSLGEIIDRMTLRFQCKTPDDAALLTCEQLLNMTSQLTDKQILKSMVSTIAILLELLNEHGVYTEDLKKIVKDKLS